MLNISYDYLNHVLKIFALCSVNRVGKDYQNYLGKTNEIVQKHIDHVQCIRGTYSVHDVGKVRIRNDTCPYCLIPRKLISSLSFNSLQIRCFGENILIFWLFCHCFRSKSCVSAQYGLLGKHQLSFLFLHVNRFWKDFPQMIQNDWTPFLRVAI